MKALFLFAALTAATLSGLAAPPVLAQAGLAIETPAPGEGLDLKGAAPVIADGPLTPDIKIEPEPGPPASKAMDRTKPFPVNPAIAEALADKTPAQREEFARNIAEAARLLQANEVQASLEHILAAEAIFSDFPALHNLKGAAFSKTRDFDKATAAFRKCLELDPSSLEARFNIAEMDFVQKNYDKAYEQFSALITENPKMPAMTRSLLQYKNFLCLLLLDRSEEAAAIFDTFRFDSDTPEFYYANAAKEFHRKDDEEARGWLRSASRIYDPSLQTLYLDSLIEAGWIDTL